MRKIILYIVVGLILTHVLMTSCKNESHDMCDIYEIKEITLVDSLIVRKNDMSFIPPKLETKYRYKVKLSNNSTNRDTTISITRNHKHETCQYIGEIVQILNNELCYPREIP